MLAFQKDKKDKAEKQKRKKHTLAETEVLDLELEPPKAKKIKKKKEMADKNEDAISECNSISHMSNGVKHSKKENNSGEDTECESDQDQVRLFFVLNIFYLEMSILYVNIIKKKDQTFYSYVRAKHNPDDSLV